MSAISLLACCPTCHSPTVAYKAEKHNSSHIKNIDIANLHLSTFGFLKFQATLNVNEFRSTAARTNNL